MKLLRNILALLFLFFTSVVGAQVSSNIAELERQKAQAVEDGNFKLAGELKKKIQDQKEKELLEKEEQRKREAAEKPNTGTGSASQFAKEIEILEKEKKAAVQNHDFALANELKKKIEALKEKEELQKSAQNSNSAPASQTSREIEKLEKEKKEAVQNHDFALASELQKKIKALKEKEELLISDQNKNSTAALQTSQEIERLEKEKKEAVQNHDFKRAGELQGQILALKEKQASGTPALAQKSAVDKEIEYLEKEKAEAVADANYKLAGEINARIKELKSNPRNTIAPANNNELTAQIQALEKEKARAVELADYKLAGEINNKIKNLKNPQPQGSTGQISFNSAGGTSIANSNTRISRSGENEMAGIKYRRSSIYTIMRSNPKQDYASVIERAFVNSPVPGKFNDHNLKTKVIQQSTVVTDELANQIAREMIAVWFNRDHMGRFNMDLIAQRGEYNASNMDYQIAKASARGLALLKDAGEELISNTFVIINEFHYTNKEEVASTASKLTRLGGSLVSAYTGTDITAYTNLAAAGMTVAGKGYVVKNKSHLYQLVWNEEIAAVFYNDYWIDANNYDENKKRAFENSKIFTLNYIGYENSWQDLQSSIFTNKTEEELITKATTKAIDAGIAKLERKFEQFRTKTPLHTVDPLTAKIGKKEGLQPEDKFEVLEQVQDPNGKIRYVRKGIIRVDGNNIWENTNTIEELEAMGIKSNLQNQYTVFRGGTGYAPGMLIRQVN